MGNYISLHCRYNKPLTSIFPSPFKPLFLFFGIRARTYLIQKIKKEAVKIVLEKKIQIIKFLNNIAISELNTNGLHIIWDTEYKTENVNCPREDPLLNHSPQKDSLIDDTLFIAYHQPIQIYQDMNLLKQIANKKKNTFNTNLTFRLWPIKSSSIFRP